MNINEKIIHLNNLLNEKYHVTLDKAIKTNDEKHFEQVLKKKEEPNEEELKQICEIFYLEEEVLADKEKELPHDGAIQVDEDLLNVRAGEYQNLIGKKKSKNVIKKNYSLLDSKGKRKFWINLGITVVPFLAYVLYSLISVSTNVIETLNT